MVEWCRWRRENGGEWEEKERRVDSGDLTVVVDLVLVVEWRRWWGQRDRVIFFSS